MILFFTCETTIWDADFTCRVFALQCASVTGTWSDDPWYWHGPRHDRAGVSAQRARRALNAAAFQSCFYWVCPAIFREKMMINLINNVKQSNSEVLNLSTSDKHISWLEQKEHQTRLKWPRQGDPTEIWWVPSVPSVPSMPFLQSEKSTFPPGPKRSHHCSTWELSSSTKKKITVQPQLGAWLSIPDPILAWHGFFGPNLNKNPT